MLRLACLLTVDCLACSDLRHNKLHGSIPAEFSQLTNLRTLDLSCNELSGKAPDMEYSSIDTDCELYSRACSLTTSDGNKFSSYTDSAKADCHCEAATPPGPTPSTPPPTPAPPTPSPACGPGLSPDECAIWIDVERQLNITWPGECDLKSTCSCNDSIPVGCDDGHLTTMCVI